MRNLSAQTERLPLGFTVEEVFWMRPSFKSEYIGLDKEWNGMESKARELMALPAGELAKRILSPAQSHSRDELIQLVRFFGMSEGYTHLDPSIIKDVQNFITSFLRPMAAAYQYLFYLDVAYGIGYDKLANRFRSTVDFRWDLGDAARHTGEKAALEAVLAAAGGDFGVLESTIDLAAMSVSRANVSKPFRQGLVDFAVSSELFWTTLGKWSTGTLPLLRGLDVETDPTFLRRNDMPRIFGYGGASGDKDYIVER